MNLSRSQLWGQFWIRFNEAVKEKNIHFKPQKNWNRNYYLIKLGIAGCYIGIDLIQRENRIRVGLYMQDQIDLYNKLSIYKEKIDSEVNTNLIWGIMKNGKAARACLYLEDFDLYDEFDYPMFINTLISYSYKYYLIFKKYLDFCK